MGMFRTEYRGRWRQKTIVANRDSGISSPWLAGGIDPSSVVAIYRPSIASNLAESYLRVSGSGGNANLDPAVVGSGVSPSFSSGSWVFNGGQFLNTGITTMAINWSVVVKYSGVGAGFRFLYGVFAANDNCFALRFASPSMNPYNGATAYFGPFQDSGVYSICGKSVYRGVSLDGTLGAGGSVPSIDFYIGALNSGGSPSAYAIANIHEFFVYSITLTNSQVAAIVTAIGT